MSLAGGAWRLVRVRKEERTPQQRRPREENMRAHVNAVEAEEEETPERTGRGPEERVEGELMPSWPCACTHTHSHTIQARAHTSPSSPFHTENSRRSRLMARAWKTYIHAMLNRRKHKHRIIENNTKVNTRDGGGGTSTGDTTATTQESKVEHVHENCPPSTAACG